MTGLVVVAAIVLRWVCRCLTVVVLGLARAAEWLDPDPEWVEVPEGTWDEIDAEIVPLFGRVRRG